MTRTHWAAITAVVLALLFAGAATVASAGGSGNDGANLRTPAATSADAGFARDMSVHHQQAVEMSFIVRDRTKDDEVRRLAYDIANTQANQRGMMLGWLDLWGLPKVSTDSEPMAWMMPDMKGAHATHSGHQAKDGSLMPGMATNTDLGRLGRAGGKQAEIEYLQLMIIHHNGGISMAEGCVKLCTVDTERNLAQGMVDAQRSEVGLMVDLLHKRGAEVRT
ncbi:MULTISPECIES: DUF305 domain-containing protein [unclassified Streptomyces]|uniref:DUF305 domain-containing protein n=1 Tax=unclassified Streptomyces TaxID=2593676 RepID=UPI002DDA0939|nr:DUF305 domain-containing protein [Streptomyces sp. NBC_01750]WSB03144.1 DUF305 domain-containing protein [Streptomyces sp. NBC_01794]WSD32586.1 DUF305 domain-containing protein [Streptomyces sp. NBC_01750]